jgi:hypothetical protein
MTKKQVAQAKRDAWRLAVSEGRVVRFPDGLTFKECKTVADAEALAADVGGNVVVSS